MIKTEQNKKNKNHNNLRIHDYSSKKAKENRRTKESNPDHDRQKDH